MLPGVTYTRIKEALERRGLAYTEETDRIVIVFPPLITWLRIDQDGILTILGLWRADITNTADCEKAYTICQQINSDFYFTKAYFEEPTVERAGSICFEFEVPIVDGLSDAQLDNNIDSAIFSMFQAETLVAKQLPHLVTWETEGE